MKINEIKLKETTAGATSSGSIAVSIGSVGSGMIARDDRKKKNKKKKNPFGIEMPKDALFAGKKNVGEGTKPKYRNKQVKGKSPMPKLTKPTAGHESPHPFRGKLVGEGSIPDDKAAGIKWADDPDWKKLHDMDLDMVQDFISHKKETNEAPSEPLTPAGLSRIFTKTRDTSHASPARSGRPRGGPHIENVRFWDLPKSDLDYIRKDAYDAMKANPEGKKAGKYADELNDAETVLYWRKMHGSDEVKPLRWHLTHEYHVKYAKSKKGPIKISKFATHDQAKEFLADVEKDGMKGIISKRGKPVKEEIELDDVSTKKMNTAKSQFRRGMSETPTEEYVQSGTFGTFKTAPVTIEIVKKGKGRLDAILKGAGKKQRLATYVQKHTPEELIARLEKTYGGKFNQSGGVNWNAGVETYHGEGWKVGDVYHQEFENGDRVYFRADSVQKNKRWKGLSVDEFGGRQKKAKNSTADENLSSWKITPKNEIPKALKEDEGLDEGWPSGRIEDPMNNAAKLKIFDKLKKGGTVKIKFDFGSLRDLGGHFKVLDKKLVGKGQRYEEEQITMTKVGAKKVGGYALHNRGGNVRFVVGEYPASIVDMKEEVGLDEVTPSVVKKAGRRSAGSWGRPGSKKQKRAASKSSRQWNLNDIDPGDGGSGSELRPEGPYAIVWHGQYLEWYGDGDPAEGEGRYKSKGDAGNVLAKNIPTYAIAQKLLSATEKMSDVGDDGDYGKDGSLVTNSSAPEIVPMSELGKHFYGYDSDSQEYGAKPEQDDHYKVMDLADVEERKLSEPEKKNKEHNVKKLKKHKKSFSKYGKDADSVMYAVATRDAKKGKKYK